MRRRIFAAFALIGLAVGFTIGNAAAAQAATLTACSSYYASPPSVQLINNGVTTITGSARIGCGNTGSAPQSVTVTVVLQHWEGGAWVDRGTVDTRTKAWSSRTPGGASARQVTGISSATCLNGDWRTHWTGYDNAPRTGDSAVATFVPGDSGVCGSYGGGD